MKNKTLMCGLLYVLNLFSHTSHVYDDFITRFYATKLYEDRELETADKPIVVSLGANCIPAYQSLIYGLRSASYPFDWVVSDIESIIINLEENFLHFLDIKYCSPNACWITNNYNKILFLHEYHEFNDECDMKFFPLIHAKYERRIERFRQLKNQKKVYFFRYATAPAPWTTTPEDKDSAIRLRDALNVFFEYQLPFVLVMLGSDSMYSSDWAIEGIKNYYVSEEWNQVASDLMKQNFLPIFKDLALM